MSAVRAFVARKGVCNDSFSTHTSIVPRARFTFGNLRDHTEFMRLYCDAVFRKDPLHYTELPIGATLVVVDIDLKKPHVDGELEPLPTLHTRAHVRTVYDVMAACVERMVDPVAGLTEDHLLCAVLDKAPYVANGFVKHGFHLAFYNLAMSCSDMVELHAEFALQLRQCAPFAALVETLGMRMEDAVDTTAATRNPWLLYGSSKGPGMEPYLISTVLSRNGRVEDRRLAFGATLAAARWPDGSRIEQPGDGDDEAYEWLMPLLLSMNVAHRVVVPLQRQYRAAVVRPRSVPAHQQQRAGLEAQYNEDERAANVATCRELIPMLSGERARAYNTWALVGWILFNLTNGQEV